ncbi:hypothetical protein LOZ58_004737 [Ophidiomyces ophidiicola]|nr:hypothetical protein LOZ58_004737 [Ophidiomyces ophidiicola]
MASLGEETIAGLETKKKDLESLKARQEKLIKFIDDLSEQRRELEQLTTGA